MGTMLVAIAAGTCVSGGASREMRRVLEAQQIQDRLARRLGDGVQVANKTGNFGDVIHDAGIVMGSGWTLVIAALTQGVCPPWQAIDAISNIAAALERMCRESG
jgi:beta-lactamase family protein